MELRLTARRGENLLAMIGIPVGLLLLASSIESVPVVMAGEDRTDALLPGILTLAIVATGLVNLGIGTAYERSYGVLQRLGAAPLGVGGLVAAKVAAVIVIELLLAGSLIAIAAAAFGWRPSGGISLVLLVPAVALGTAVFAGLGLALAGALRAEAVLLVANVAFLVIIGVGGVLVPADLLPGPLAGVVTVLPPAALRDAIAGALGSEPLAVAPWSVLFAWAVVVVGVASRTFRWD
jgi:ABC-2 type transport system permease protein